MGRAHRVAAVLAVLTLAAAGCSDDDGQAGEETEVLGVQVERDPPASTPAGTPTPSPSSPDEPTVDADEQSPSDDPGVPTSSAPVGSGSTATDGNDSTGSAPQPSDPPATSPPAEPSPEPAPSSVREGEGHSYVTWFSDRSEHPGSEPTDDPEGEEPGPDASASPEPSPVWSAVSAAPRRDREPTPDSHEALRVRLDDPQRDAAAGHRVLTATCGSWLTAMDDRPLEARGTVVVELVVDGAAVLEQRIPVDVVVPAGETVDLARTEGIDVDAADHDEVTCRVVFTTG